MLHKHYQQIVLTITLGLIGCNPTPTGQDTTTQPAGDRPSVIATTSVLCDMTQQVAAETIDLTCMVAPGEDPHLYQPTPEDRKAIEQADLILYGGYDFEPALIKLVEATSNPAPKVAVHEVAVSQPIMAEPHSHGHDHEHSHDDGSTAEENAPDPHVWHSAQNGIAMVETIRDNLEQIAPNHASLYNSNAQQVTSELTQIDTWIKSQIATIPPQQRKLVTTHDAMNYYSQAYGIPIEGALGGISTEEAPTAARVSELVKDIRQSSVPTIFAEATINPRLIETVAREANVQVSERKLFADGLGEPGTDADTYQNKLIANTRTIVEGLGGNYTPPQVASKRGEG